MVFSYGQREMCALGRNGNNTEILKIEGLDDIIDISCGETHSAALQNNGDLYVWGCFYNSKRDHMFIPYYCFQHKPRLITKNVVKIASCDNCVIIQDKNGDIYYYGDLKYDNSYQKLTSSELKLNKFMGARDVYPIFDSIYASRSYFFGFKTDIIYAFGNKLFGKLDDNRTYNLEQIDLDKILKIKTYKFKKMNSVIMQMTGNIIVEGYNQNSEIQYIIYNISGEKTIKYIDDIQILSCRNEAVIYVKDKQLFTWGENIYGKLGHLEKIIRKPTKLECDVGKIVGIYA
ncbi:Regulator of chromosome condensation, partial [Conglomerata obtusa]